MNDLIIKYPIRRRKLYLTQMLICIKHRRFDRVKEGLAIWIDSNDIFLKYIGIFFGNKKNIPEWYNSNHWDSINI